MKLEKRSTLIGVLLLAMSATTVIVATEAAAEPVTLTHVHGLSYSADGSRIMVPSHHGIAVYENGRWAKAAGPAHDYMGYSATADALYSSGHPAPNSGLINPFGLIKSSDGGKSWKKLGLEGESDFHLLATSYGTNTVYVVNHAKNSRMDRAGLFHTASDGLKWTRAAAKGLKAEPRALAVHPRDPTTVAAGTADGLYLSRDSGESFEQVFAGQQVLGAFFDLDGQQLWFSSHDGKASLMRLALKPGAKPQAVPMPALSDDAVAYIAQNPKRRDEFAIATFKRNVYLSKDAGQTWVAIALNGGPA